MADRAVGVVRVKATLVEARVKALEDALNEEVVDKNAIILQSNDLTTLFRSYEEAYENLMIYHKDSVEPETRKNIHTLYYTVTSKVEKLKTPDNSTINSTLPTPIANSTFTERAKLMKLPIAPIPKFDGDYTKWISFKNAFLTMVDSRTDYDEVGKFVQLRNALEGEALRKISLYDISAENYVIAWKTLTEVYERKRILVCKHIDAILDLSPIKILTSSALSKLVDELRLHLNMLNSLKIPEETRFAIRIAERALPSKIRQKWEQSLELDQLPNLETFYKFMNQTIFRLYTQETDSAREGGDIMATKRKSEVEKSSKMKKTNEGLRSLVTDVKQNCHFCQESHTLYQCPKFREISVSNRWAFVKTKGICVNCLREHEGKCGFGHCKRCQRYHHSLLHQDAKTTNKTSNNQTLPTILPSDSSNNAL